MNMNILKLTLISQVEFLEPDVTSKKIVVENDISSLYKELLSYSFLYEVKLIRNIELASTTNEFNFIVRSYNFHTRTHEFIFSIKIDSDLSIYEGLPESVITQIYYEQFLIEGKQSKNE